MRRKDIASGVFLLALFSALAAAHAAPAPEVHISDTKQLPVPLPYPYIETADADAAVDAALARARADGKRVLIDLGGNWCPDCRILAGVMDLPEVKPFMQAHFELVSVDVGHFDKNLQIAARFHVPKVDGVPWLIVVDPDGTVLASSDDVTDDNHRTPQSMVDWLARWAR